MLLFVSGVLNLKFDNQGNLNYFGGQPIYLDSSIPQEQDVLELLEKYRPGLDTRTVKVIGKSKKMLDGNSTKCRIEECTLGNLITDAYVMYAKSIGLSDLTIIGLQNGGGIRNTIEPESNGDITYGKLIAALPFNNQIAILKLNGSDLLKTLEIGVKSNGETSRGEFLQVSGLKVVYNMRRQPYSRVISVKIKSQRNGRDIYEDLVLYKNYTIVTNSFLAQGGDNQYLLSNHGFDKTMKDVMDIDVVKWYIKKMSPLEPRIEGRITIRRCRKNRERHG